MLAAGFRFGADPLDEGSMSVRGRPVRHPGRSDGNFIARPEMSE
jgi:hypothetical protein